MRNTIGFACVVAAVTATPVMAKGAADPKASAIALVKQQVASLESMIESDSLPEATYTDDAAFSIINDTNDGGQSDAAKLGDATIPGCAIHRHTVKDVRAMLAADRQTAVVSFSVGFDLKCDVSGDYFHRDERATELVVMTKNGWRVVGGLWSQDMKNGPINAAAAKGQLPALAPVADGEGDAGVRAAVDALLAKGLDDTAAKRKELIAIGSGPKEVTTSGPAFATPWKAAWVGHTTLDGKVHTRIAPSGTTAWAIANLKRTKTKGASSYTIPHRALFVFDKVGDSWSLVHVTLAVPPPAS